MPVRHDGVTMHLGPREAGGPDELAPPLVAFIDGAEKELCVAIQEIDHPPIAEALSRARRRGVTVKVVLESDYLVESRPVAEDREGARAPNHALLVAMLRAAVDVKSDFNPHIFHQKFIVRDRASVLTGSTNFTTTGVTGNLNHLVIVEHREVAMQYWREFREISQGVFGARSDAHGRHPEQVWVGKMRVKPLFAPEHGPEMEIMKLMAKARERVDFAIFTFAESSGIDDQMIATVARGVPVRGAFDRKQANQDWAASHKLREGGVDIHQLKPVSRGGARKLHHKLMVLDDRCIVAGSFNYTGPANYVNDENILVIGDLGPTDPDFEAIEREFARPVREEIERIIAEQCEPL